MRYFAFFFVLVCVDTVCLCGAQSEPVAPREGASCGCENLKRTAAVEPVEDETGSEDPAVRYSRGANERLSEAQGDEKTFQSQVIFLCCYVKTKQLRLAFIVFPLL